MIKGTRKDVEGFCSAINELKGSVANQSLQLCLDVTTRGKVEFEVDRILCEARRKMDEASALAATILS